MRVQPFVEVRLAVPDALARKLQVRETFGAPPQTECPSFNSDVTGGSGIVEDAGLRLVCRDRYNFCHTPFRERQRNAAKAALSVV